MQFIPRPYVLPKISLKFKHYFLFFSHLTLLFSSLQVYFLSGGKYRILVIEPRILKVWNGRRVALEYQKVSDYPTLRCTLLKNGKCKGKVGSSRYGCALRRCSSPARWPLAPVVAGNHYPGHRISVASASPQCTFPGFLQPPVISHSERRTASGVGCAPPAGIMWLTRCGAVPAHNGQEQTCMIFFLSGLEINGEGTTLSDRKLVR